MVFVLDIGMCVGDYIFNIGSFECGMSCGKLSIDFYVGYVID